MFNNNSCVEGEQIHRSFFFFCLQLNINGVQQQLHYVKVLEKLQLNLQLLKHRLMIFFILHELFIGLFVYFNDFFLKFIFNLVINFYIHLKYQIVLIYLILMLFMMELDLQHNLLQHVQQYQKHFVHLFHQKKLNIFDQVKDFIEKYFSYFFVQLVF